MRRRRDLTRKQLSRHRREERLRQVARLGAAAVILLVAGLVAWGVYQERVIIPQQPIAVVNGVAIPTRQYQERVIFQRAQLNNFIDRLNDQLSAIRSDPNQAVFAELLLEQRRQAEQRLEQLPSAALEQIIEEELLRQEAQARGITVSEEEIQQAIEEQFGLAPTPTPGLTATSESTPTAPLAEATLTPTPAISLEASFRAQYQRVLESLRQLGLSEAFYRGLFAQQLLRDKLRQAVAAQVPEVEPQLKLSHILLKTREEAEAALARLSASGGGEDFALLAQELSQDPGTSSQGGDLGWAPRGTYDPAFEEAAWALAPREISAIVETGFGFHIIQVLERDEARLLDPALMEQRREEAFLRWLEEHKAAARIERFLIPSTPTSVPSPPALTPTATNG